jgi:hypothetical protein
MGCHPRALKHLAAQIRRDPANTDQYLDQWFDVTTRATEWDADQWGLDPDRWMAKDRAQMERAIQRLAEQGWRLDPTDPHRLLPLHPARRATRPPSHL